MIFKFLIFSVLFYCGYGAIIAKKASLLGSNECTWGPSYWCGSLQSAKSCSAVHHCIQKVWNTMTVPEDKDDICTICKDMVKQARDQLESNETMDELKQVLEGSCKLIYIKPIVKECQRLADEFVPELVETLSSEMNPDVVCSVAGLCNNVTIDKMIDDYKKSQPSNPATQDQIDRCHECNFVMSKIEKKFNQLSESQVLDRFLQACGHLGSYSDACSSVVLENFDHLYNHMKENFKTKSVCHLAGVCSFNYHKHENKKVEIVPESKIGVVKIVGDAFTITVKDREHDSDEECDMCTQLISYLRNVLIANTTEDEFQLVLRGLCKQTGQFKQQCLSIVDEYYGEIYEFLVNKMNGSYICSLLDICPRPGVYNGPMWPLIPERPVPITHVATGELGIKVVAKPSEKKEISFGEVPEDVSSAQLPIERMYTGQKTLLHVDNKETCIFCEYFLHYIQEQLAEPREEERIKKLVEEGCDKLPKSVRSQCRQFVEVYGNAFVAILVEEIDPSQVCPSLGLCPARQLSDHYEVVEITGKPGCPLCLLAVEELDKKLKDNRTEASVKTALDNLCSKLPKRLRSQCDDFVEEYTEELIDMMLADFTPQEVCTYLKLCPTSSYVQKLEGNVQPERPEILTNEIPEYVPTDTDKTLITTDYKVYQKESTQCVICEFVLSKLDDLLKDNATEEDIKWTVKNVCSHLPKTVRRECNDFVDQYADAIIELLQETLEPKEVCTLLKLCTDNRVEGSDEVLSKAMFGTYQQSIEECALCEAIVGALAGVLEDKTIDRNITALVEKVCPMLPTNKQAKCQELIESYGPSILNLIIDMGVRPGIVCWKLSLCDAVGQTRVNLIDMNGRDVKMDMITVPPKEDNGKLPQGHLIGGNRCTWGPSYWCQSEDHANACGTIQHCRERVWKDDKPQAA